MKYFLSIWQKAPKAVDQALNIFRAHGGMLRTGEALRLGIHPRTLYMLRDRGDLEAIAHGLFRISTSTPLGNPDVVTVALRAPRAVICLISALSHYGLTTQVPHVVDIALPRHTKPPKISNIPIRVYWFSASALTTGQEVRIDHIPVLLYSPEKTIADCFKFRNKVGLDVAIEALKTYRERTRKPNRAALLEYARMLRVERVMRPYMEALL